MHAVLNALARPQWEKLTAWKAMGIIAERKPLS